MRIPMDGAGGGASRVHARRRVSDAGGLRYPRASGHACVHAAVDAHVRRAATVGARACCTVARACRYYGVKMNSVSLGGGAAITDLGYAACAAARPALVGGNAEVMRVVAGGALQGSRHDHR